MDIPAHTKSTFVMKLRTRRSRSDALYPSPWRSTQRKLPVVEAKYLFQTIIGIMLWGIQIELYYQPCMATSEIVCLRAYPHRHIALTRPQDQGRALPQGKTEQDSKLCQIHSLSNQTPRRLMRTYSKNAIVPHTQTATKVLRSLNKSSGQYC